MSKMNTDFLQDFADAWNRHDINGLMSFMTDDCIFDAGGGPDPWGERYRGQQSVRERYEQVWKDIPDARWDNCQHMVSGNLGLSEWTFYGTSEHGLPIEIQGCDVFIFRDGKIASKSTYLKNRS